VTLQASFRNSRRVGIQVSIDRKLLARQSILIDNKLDPEITVKVIPKQHVISSDDLKNIQVKVQATYSHGSGLIPAKGSAKLKGHVNNNTEKVFDIIPGTFNILNLSSIKYKLNQQNETEILLKALFKDEKTKSKSFGSSKKIYKKSSDLIVDFIIPDDYFTPEKQLNVTISKN
jgi:hypothetical protein